MMKLLIKSTKIIDPLSKHHNQKKDILVINGKIKSISNNIKSTGSEKVVDIKGSHVSPGWFDLYACFNDPGFEQKEDLNTGTRAAAKGGFTGVACIPETNPPLHSKSEIEYVINQTTGNIVDVYPVGAVSCNRDGEDITEMYDMNDAGAVAFSDGDHPILNEGLMLRSLQYAKRFNGVIYSNTSNPAISLNGTVNESAVSTELGLQGIPPVAEELMVIRDIYLAEYTGSTVHFPFISTKKSVDLVKSAKAKGVNVTASIAAHALALEETALHNYDSNYKVNPPIRSKADINAIIKGLANGTIDAVCSQHMPQEEDSKKVEFEFASYGIIGMETAFGLLCTALKDVISIEQMINTIAINPRKILNLPLPSLKVGCEANLTLFDPKKKWAFTSEDIGSKSQNSPFIGKNLVGKPLGIINNDQLYIV